MKMSSRIQLLLSNRLLKECLVYRRLDAVPDTVYNNAWNREQGIQEKEQKAEHYKTELRKCIVLNKMLKKGNFVAFLENQLLD